MLRFRLEDMCHLSSSIGALDTIGTLEQWTIGASEHWLGSEDEMCAAICLRLHGVLSCKWQRKKQVWERSSEDRRLLRHQRRES